jgi:hypothetical protein
MVERPIVSLSRPDFTSLRFGVILFPLPTVLEGEAVIILLNATTLSWFEKRSNPSINCWVKVVKDFSPLQKQASIPDNLEIPSWKL